MMRDKRLRVSRNFSSPSHTRAHARVGPREVTWQPGTPIRTEEDWREWQEWRKESILVAQRKRRAQLRGVEYAACLASGGGNNRRAANQRHGLTSHGFLPLVTGQSRLFRRTV